MIKNYIIFASMGFELVGLIIGCFYLGQYLDQKYNSKGLIFVGLSFAALIGWLWRVIWLLRRMQKNEEKQDTESKKSGQ
ncbi:AtpZ/AtpI family protein [Bdellovibrio bacteriovorus]